MCDEMVETLQDMKDDLVKNIDKRITEFDERRKRYKHYMKYYHIFLTIASVIPLVCISMSFIEGMDIAMRVAAIMASAVGLIFTRIFRVETYNLKVYQRTKTCLKLRALLRQIKYEMDWDDQKIKKYVQDFQTIMKEDTEMTLKNLELQMEQEEVLFQNDIIS